jgi:hypothetical protein
MTETANPFLEWALHYAREKHWPVFPLVEHSKKPFKDTRGLLDATTNEEQIVKWWTTHPHANVAVRTGETCWVLDKDEEGEATLAQLIAQHGRLRDTLQAITPNGGTHFFYLPPANVAIPTRAPARDDWKGIDVRGQGGYVAVHPSEVRNDAGVLKRYEWDGIEGELEPVSDADPWLIEAIVEGSRNSGKKAFEALKDPQKFPKGSQQRILVSIAGKLRDLGLDPVEIEPLLQVVNQRRCSEPGPKQNIHQYATSVIYPPKHAIEELAGEETDTPPGAPPAGTLIIECLNDIEPVPVSWLWHHRIPRGKLSVVAGIPGLGKSQVGASMAAIITRGAKWPVDLTPSISGSVLFLTAEDAAEDTLRPRLEAAGADLKRCHFVRGVIQGYDGNANRKKRMFSFAEDMEALGRTLRELHDAALVVIDPISAYLGKIDAHKNAEVRAVLGPVSDLAAETNVAIVGITHLNKSAGSTALLRVIDSIAFVAAARSSWLVAADPEDKTRRLFLPLKNNLAEEQSGLAFTIQGRAIHSPCGEIETSCVTWDSQTVDISADDAVRVNEKKNKAPSKTDEATEWLRLTLADGPMPSSKLTELAGKCGIAYHTLRRAQEELHIRPY